MRRRSFLGLASIFPFGGLTKVLPESNVFIHPSQIAMLDSDVKSKILASFPNGFHATSENIEKMLGLGANHFEMVSLKIPISRCFIDKNNTQYWWKNGLLHRDNDLPAVIYNDGAKGWYQNGLRHRDNDLPAIVEPDGTSLWYKNGKLHRDNDLPAVIYTSGAKEWWRNGEKYNTQSCENQNVDNAQLNSQDVDSDKPQLEFQNSNNNDQDNQPIAFLSKEQIKMIDFYETTSILNVFPEGVYLTQENVNKLIGLGLSLQKLIDLRIPINGVFINNGETHHLLNGLHHSFNDLPAMINADGDQYWYQDGKLHRDNDLPTVVFANERKE